MQKCMMGGVNKPPLNSSPIKLILDNIRRLVLAAFSASATAADPRCISLSRFSSSMTWSPRNSCVQNALCLHAYPPPPTPTHPHHSFSLSYQHELLLTLVEEQALETDLRRCKVGGRVRAKPVHRRPIRRVLLEVPAIGCDSGLPTTSSLLFNLCGGTKVRQHAASRRHGKKPCIRGRTSTNPLHHSIDLVVSRLHSSEYMSWKKTSSSAFSNTSVITYTSQSHGRPRPIVSHSNNRTNTVA